MIATLTLNPAIDKSFDIEELIAEKKMRCNNVLIEAGGGGINVSKAIHELGGKSLAIFPHGGTNGDLLLHLLKKKGIKMHGIRIKEETRENFVATELSTNKQYRFVLPGPKLNLAEVTAVRRILSLLPSSSFLVCSGSLPPGVDPSFIGELSQLAKQKGIKLIIDTSGEPLKIALENGVYLIKPNLTELCSLVGTNHLEASEIREAAMQVLSRWNCKVMVVSMGPRGALLVTKKVIKQFSAPAVKKLSTVGAGDSMIAGIVWMLHKGRPLQDAVQFGVACGTAATLTKGTQLFRREDAIHLYKLAKKRLQQVA